ncbi:hypothetical protein PPYR_07277 [Photinus pyralis]|uniref:Uncharacterized protein n=1 Tax=Photinus pyralis TaxID=7054 RepID=A0A5N4APZ1_PHOPY|nr:hypothetical protein PPYR_07277 [Photinus pyralis]
MGNFKQINSQYQASNIANPCLKNGSNSDLSQIYRETDFSYSLFTCTVSFQLSMRLLFPSCRDIIQ